MSFPGYLKDALLGNAAYLLCLGVDVWKAVTWLIRVFADAVLLNPPLLNLPIGTGLSDLPLDRSTKEQIFYVAYVLMSFPGQ